MKTNTEKKARYVAPRYTIRVNPKTGERSRVALTRPQRKKLYAQHRLDVVEAKRKEREESRLSRTNGKKVYHTTGNTPERNEYIRILRLGRRTTRLVKAFAKGGFVGKRQTKILLGLVKRPHEISEVKTVLAQLAAA